MIKRKRRLNDVFFCVFLAWGTTPAYADFASLIEYEQNIYLKSVKKSLNIVTHVNITIILLFVIIFISNMSKLVEIIYILNISFL